MVHQVTPIWLLKWGPKYKAEHVNALVDRLARFTDARVLCWTDDPSGVRCETRALPDIGLRGWWWKVWLFSQAEPFLFMDLDVVPVGDLAPMVHATGPLTIIKDPWQAGYNSSVFKTDGSLARIWHDFTPAVARRLHGDQDWITEQAPGADLWPAEWCRSYKADLRKFNPPGPACRVVYFHGRPKPWEVSHTWL